MMQGPQHLPEFARVNAERESHNESSDCSVVALSIAVGIPYDVAHDILAKAGRRSRHGFQMTAWLADQARLGITCCGYKFTQTSCGKINYRTAGYTYPTVAKVHRDFPKGRFMVSVSGHIFAMIDGVILDYNGPRRQVKKLTLVERA